MSKTPEEMVRDKCEELIDRSLQVVKDAQAQFPKAEPGATMHALDPTRGPQCPNCGNTDISRMGQRMRYSEGRRIVVGPCCFNCGHTERELP